MKKVLKVVLSVALVMSATSIHAQKFGRINSQEIIMSMPETEEMRTNLEAFGKELEENIETINVEFNNKFQEYQKTANTLTESVREMKAKELEDLQRRSQEFQQRAQQDYPEAAGTAPAHHREGPGCDREGVCRRWLSCRIRHFGRFAGLFR